MLHAQLTVLEGKCAADEPCDCVFKQCITPGQLKGLTEKNSTSTKRNCQPQPEPNKGRNVSKL